MTSKRPHKALNKSAATFELLNKIFSETAGFEDINGSQKPVSNYDAILKTLLKKSSEGNAKALKVLNEERKKFPSLNAQLRYAAKGPSNRFPLIRGGVLKLPECVVFEDFCEEFNSGMTEERWQFYIRLAMDELLELGRVIVKHS
jgi:hypothetical protein